MVGRPDPPCSRAGRLTARVLTVDEGEDEYELHDLSTGTGFFRCVCVLYSVYILGILLLASQKTIGRAHAVPLHVFPILIFITSETVFCCSFVVNSAMRSYSPGVC